MKAKIAELWNTSIEIISVAGGTFDENGDGYSDDEITSIEDLKKCDNVLVGDKELHGYEIMLDNSLMYVSFRLISHPSGAGRLYICEVQ